MPHQMSLEIHRPRLLRPTKRTQKHRQEFCILSALFPMTLLHPPLVLRQLPHILLVVVIPVLATRALHVAARPSLPAHRARTRPEGLDSRNRRRAQLLRDGRRLAQPLELLRQRRYSTLARVIGRAQKRGEVQRPRRIGVDGVGQQRDDGRLQRREVREEVEAPALYTHAVFHPLVATTRPMYVD